MVKEDSHIHSHSCKWLCIHIFPCISVYADVYTDMCSVQMYMQIRVQSCMHMYMHVNPCKNPCANMSRHCYCPFWNYCLSTFCEIKFSMKKILFLFRNWNCGMPAFAISPHCMRSLRQMSWTIRKLSGPQSPELRLCMTMQVWRRWSRAMSASILWLSSGRPSSRIPRCLLLNTGT